MPRLRIKVTGRVQGVGYRYFARAEAQALELRGRVWNAPDGSVVAIAEGPGDLLESYLQRLSRGPGMGHVDNVTTKPDVGTEPLNGFTIEI